MTHGSQVLLRAPALSIFRSVVRPPSVLGWSVKVLLGGEPRSAGRREPHLAVIVMSEHHVRVVDAAGDYLTAEVRSMAEVLWFHGAIGQLMAVDGGGTLRAVVAHSIRILHAHAVWRIV